MRGCTLLFFLLAVVLCLVKAAPTFLPTSNALGDPPSFASLFMGPLSSKKDKKDKNDDDDDDDSEGDKDKKGKKDKGKDKNGKKDKDKKNDDGPFSQLSKVFGLGGNN